MNEHKEIESRCRSDKMLSENEELSKLIKSDEKTVADLGITFQQISNFFEYLVLYCNSKYAIDFKFEFKFKDNIDRAYWNLNYSKSIKIKLNEIEYNVLIYSWNGSASCPFENKCIDGYGSKDYFIYRCDNDAKLHIGDLLFHQISEHHFFQSESSNYRVEPNKLIEFFNLKPHVDYKANIEEYKWRSTIAYIHNREHRINFFESADSGNMWSKNAYPWNTEEFDDYIFYFRKRPDKPFEEYGIFIKDKDHRLDYIIHNDVKYNLLYNVQCHQYHETIRILKRLC